MIIVKDLGKQYGDQVLFEDINFVINPQDRIGIVGRNGHGKSTLFKMIAGVESIDQGDIKIPDNYKVGYLDQHINFTHNTVLEEGCSALSEDDKDNAWKVEKVLSGLGYSEGDFQRHPDEFSGGYQMRLNLAKVLVSEPDLLMLDEPTNFLDIVSIRWLNQFLKKWTSEVVLISHDRTFMDGIVNQVLGIHRGQVMKVNGSTDDYYSKIELNEEVHEKNRLNLEKKKKQAQQFIDRFRANAKKATQIQSRLKAVEKMGSIEKLRAVKDLYFKFNEAPKPPKYCLDVKELTFGYSDDHILIDDLSLTVANDDRIGIIGKNGQGKSTLMNLLAQQLEPMEGDISHHPKTTMAHFQQANVANLRNNMTVLEEILDARKDHDLDQARRTCGAMMFGKKTALKNISVLSGGEKSRVILGRLLGVEANLLLLDEPTHHLDMQSSQAMIDAVNNFDGATIIVTHDEHFLRSVANRLIVFQKGEVTLFEGGYDDFLSTVGWDDSNAPIAKKKRVKKDNSALEAEKQHKLAEYEEALKKHMAPLQTRLDEAQAKFDKVDTSIKKKEAKLSKIDKNTKHQEYVELEKSITQTKGGYNKAKKVLDNTQRDFDNAKNKFHKTYYDE